jgi:hypothetical protein
MKDMIKNAYRWIERNPSGIIVTFFIILIPIYFIIWQIFEPLSIPEKCLSIINYRIYWHITLAIIISFILTIALEFIFRKALWKIYSVSYEAHNQDIGWSAWKVDGELSGSSNLGLRMEAIRIKLGHRVPAGIDIEYQVHIQDQGWLPPVRNGAKAGTEGQALRLEAIRIKLINHPNNYSVIYSVRLANSTDWSIWYCDNQIAGTTGEAQAIEAIRILVLKS